MNRRAQEDEFTALSPQTISPQQGKTLEPSTHLSTAMFLLSSFIYALSSWFLVSDPLFVNLSSTAASAMWNWWAEAVSHTEVTVRTCTCTEAEGVILAGLHAQSQLPIMWLLLPASHTHDPIRRPDLSNQLLWQPAGRRADRGSTNLISAFKGLEGGWEEGRGDACSISCSVLTWSWRPKLSNNSWLCTQVTSTRVKDAHK